MCPKDPIYISHTHPSDGRHLSFFAKINKQTDRYDLQDELRLNIDILKKEEKERLTNLRQLLIQHYLQTIPALTILDDKLIVLDLYIEAYDKLLSELKAFYGDGITEDPTEDRTGSSYNVQDVKEDYWLNWDLRFVHQATHTFDSTPVSIGLGIFTALLVSPSILITFLLQLLPIKSCFSHDGDDFINAEPLEQKNRLFDALLKDKAIDNSSELKEAIQLRRPS